VTTDSGPADLSFEDALARLSDPETRPEARLVSMLSAPSDSELSSWRETWPTIAHDRRRWIATLMLDTAEASFEYDFRQLFVELLDDGEAEVRAVAIDGLWESEEPRLIGRFVSLLENDSDLEVRARAASALGPFVLRGELDEVDREKTDRAVDALVAVAADEDLDPEVRRRAVESAGFADRDDVRVTVRAFSNSKEEALKAGALRAMGNSADEAWGPVVLSALSADKAQLRFEGAHAAGELTLEEAVPELCQLAESDEREIRFEAVWALGEIGGSAATRALERIGARTNDADLIRALEDALAMAALDDGEISFPTLGGHGTKYSESDWEEALVVDQSGGDEGNNGSS
jgi:hypothetical protein